MQAEQTRPRLTAGVLKERYWKHYADKATVSPCHTNRASDLGHPCLRYLVLSRTNWQDRKPPSAETMMIFGEGNEQERAMARALMDMGFDIQQAQKALSYPDFQITGHLDWRISYAGYESSVCEMKSMNPHIWDSVNSIADLIHAKQPWLRKYPAQLQLYLLLEARDEAGILILKNKSSGVPKFIDFTLDYEYAESLLQKATAINKHVAEKTLPDCIALSDSDVCDRCDFYGRACDPARSWGDGAAILQDDELIQMLERREALKESHKEYQSVDELVKKRIKAALGEKATGICGDFIVETKPNKNGEVRLTIKRANPCPVSTA